VCSVQCEVCSVQFEVCSVQLHCSVCSVQCSVCSVHLQCNCSERNYKIETMFLVFRNKTTGNSINAGSGTQLRVFKDSMGIEMSWILEGTLAKGTIRSILDNSKLIQPAEENLSENCPVELLESQGKAAEVWHIQRVRNQGDLNVINAYVECGADGNFVLAEHKGMLVVQEKNEKNSEYQVWEVVGDGGGSTNVIDDTCYEFQLPGIEYIPEGFESLSNITVTAPDGAKDDVWVWSIPTDQIGIIYKNIFYTVIVDTSTQCTQTSLSATVKDGQIIQVTQAELMPSITLKDWLNLDDHWTRDTLKQIKTLVSRGIVTKIDKISLSSDLLEPVDVLAATPVMSIANTVTIEGIKMNIKQWEEVEKSIGEGIECFELGGGVKVDDEIVDAVLVVCKKANEVMLQDVQFEDIGKFLTIILYTFSRKEVRCELLTFGVETVKQYKAEIQEFGDKLGWFVTVDEQYIKMKKDDKIEERQKEYAENAWKVLSADDKIDCLKLQFDFMEKKLDKLTEMVTEGVGLNKERRRELWQMQDNMNKMKCQQEQDRIRRWATRNQGLGVNSFW